MKSILLIMDYAPPYRGNFISSIEFLQKQLQKKDCQFVYLFTDKAKYLDWVIDLQKNNKIYFIDNSFFSKKIKLKNIKTFTTIIKKENISIIHTHFIAYNFTLCILKLFFLKRIKFIGHFHNQFHFPNNIYSKIKVLANNITFDLTIGVGYSVAEGLCEAGIKKSKVTYIVNAIDFDRLDTYEKIILANNPKQKVVLMFGWIFHAKGVDIAIEAIRQLIEEGNDIMLAISLSGGNPIFEKEICNQIGNIPSWIKILPPRNDIATYYNAANIFLSAGREEGLNYSVIEAAYCQSLLIVSNIPGNPQDIPHILKYEVEDIASLKLLIREALNKTTEETRSIKIDQKEYVMKAYNLEQWSEEMMKLYF